MNEAWESLAFHSLERDAPTAVLDGDGKIVDVNPAWLAFGAENGNLDPMSGLGSNYISVCDQTQGADSLWARQAANGLRRVLGGSAQVFVQEYPCHSPTEQRWFQMVALPRDINKRSGAVVSHINVTRPVVKRLAQDRSHTLIKQISQRVSLSVLEIDPDGRLVEVNPAGLQLLSSAHGARALGTAFLDHVALEDRERARALVGEAFSGRVREFSYWSADEPRRSRLVRVKLVPLKDLEGGVYRILGLAEDVTDRQATIADLADLKNRYETISDLSSEFLFALTPLKDGRQSGRWTFDWTAGHLTGFEEALPQPGDPLNGAFNDVVHHQDRLHLANSLIATVAGEPVKTSVRFVSPSHGLRWIELKGELQAPADGADGQVRVAASLSDVTMQREAEGRIADEQRQATDYLNVSGALIMALDRRGHITLINRQGAAILGYGEEEVVGRDWVEQFLPEAARAGVRETYGRILAGEGGNPGFLETDVITWSGEHRVVAWYNSPLTDVNEQVVGVLCSGVDITERKQAEAQLRLLTERCEDIAGLSTEFVCGFRRADDGAFRLHWRVGALEVLQTLMPMVGQSFTVLSRLVHPEDRAQFESTRKHLLAGGSSDLVYRFLLTRGQVRWVRWHAVAKCERDGGPVTEIVSCLKDITAQVMAERTEADLRGQIEDNERLAALGSLAGGIAHDFNNILTPILGYGRIALDDVPAGSLVHDDLGRIVSAALRARDLVKQILTFSRRSHVSRRPMHVQPVVIEAIDLLRQDFSEEIDIRLDLEAECAPVEGNATQIYQVVSNLARNACQACAGGEGRVDVSLETIDVDRELLARVKGLKAGRHVRLSIADTGRGVPKEIAENIFDPFFTTKPTGRGLGMGLAVAQGIVHDHEGLIALESMPGSGARFDVYLPAYEGAADALVSSGLKRRGGGETVLVVEDDPEVARTVGRMLSRIGYEPCVITDPEQALAAVVAGDVLPDLAIVNQEMPGLKGTDLTRALKRELEGLPVVIMSGYSPDLNAQTLSDLGLDDYVLKPILIEDLAQTVAEHLNPGPDPDQATKPTVH